MSSVANLQWSPTRREVDARDAHSIPPEVRRAALRLAVANCARAQRDPVGVDDRDHHSHSSSAPSAAPAPSAIGVGPGVVEDSE
jgi:hypothetical protein